MISRSIIPIVCISEIDISLLIFTHRDIINTISIIVVIDIDYCLLPIAYCLLPIAYFLLPIAYSLLPIAC